MSEKLSWVPTDAAVSRAGVRVVRLVHFASGNVVDGLDDGCDERGAPNQQRQHLISTLKKRLKYGGKEVPTFRLNGPPGPWPEPRNDKEKAARARDTFDRDVLKDDANEWRTPSKEWLELAKKCRAAEALRDDELKRQAKSERAVKGLALLERLASAVMKDGADDEKKAKA